MWVYVVVLIELGLYNVHAPNVVFRHKSACEQWQEFDKKRLEATAPSPDHRMLSMCVMLPQEA